MRLMQALHTCVARERMEELVLVLIDHCALRLQNEETIAWQSTTVADAASPTRWSRGVLVSSVRAHVALLNISYDVIILLLTSDRLFRDYIMKLSDSLMLSRKNYGYIYIYGLSLCFIRVSVKDNHKIIQRDIIYTIKYCICICTF